METTDAKLSINELTDTIYFGGRLEVTGKMAEYPIEQFVAVKDKGMKAAWFLVTNTTLKPREIINNYSKRWKIEPFFRDLKDGRYGLGLEKTHIKSCERRDRLMLILALAYLLLVVLGKAGE